MFYDEVHTRILPVILPSMYYGIEQCAKMHQDLLSSTLKYIQEDVFIEAIVSPPYNSRGPFYYIIWTQLPPDVTRSIEINAF